MINLIDNIDYDVHDELPSNMIINRESIYDEIELEVEMFVTKDKKSKRKAYAEMERLDILQYHYFSQEYAALKACYIMFHMYVKYKSDRYLCGVMSLHVSSMNKTFRNIFFGSEFFGKFRKFMLDNYDVPAKFVTISRFVLFPQFRGIGLARKFVQLAVDEISKIDDVFMIEIYSSMLYNFDFMPNDWIKFVNLIADGFDSLSEFVNFCREAKIIRGLTEAKSVLNRALKKVDEGGRVRKADMPCAQVLSQAERLLEGTDIQMDFEAKKRNQTFRAAKQNIKRIGRTGKYLHRKSGSMYTRMLESDMFVNIASYMFYVPDDKFEYMKKYFCINDFIDYDSVLSSYINCSDMIKEKILKYKKKKTRSLPVIVDMFDKFVDTDMYSFRDRVLGNMTSQKNYEKKKASGI